MKLLALAERPNHVCYRYRVEAFAPALAERGWTLESLALSPRTLGRRKQLLHARDADVVLLERKLLPIWQLRLLRKLSRRLIYDFDDALFHRDSFNPKGPGSWTRLARFWATCYTADAVIAGNGYLREQASAYVEPGCVHWLPTCVRPELYTPAQHCRTNNIRLVWIGQQSTLPCLQYAEPLLAEAAARIPGIELRVISNIFPGLTRIPVERQTWSAASEARNLAECDIGISWLPDDPWSRGKCGLKVLQYMSAGLPVVANPVGMNRAMITHGRNGFLADTAEEWATAIARLAGDPALRARMGAAGRDMVEAHYSVERWSPRFVELVQRVSGGAHPGKAVGRGPAALDESPDCWEAA